MEQLKQSQLKYIIRQLKPIKIEFDEWDSNHLGWNVGSYYNNSFEIIEDDVYINLDLGVTSTYSTFGDNITEPSEHTRESSEIGLSIKTVMIDEDEFMLDYKQLRQLEKAIINNLEY